MSIQLDKSVPRAAGKVALVTGAASGIGRATALLLARHGAIVICADIDLAGANATAGNIQQAGGVAAEMQLDVTSEAGWQQAIKETLTRHDRLDVLVNCAGISFVAPVTEMSLEDWRRVMTINLEGVFLGTKHALLALRQSAAVEASSTSLLLPASNPRRVQASIQRVKRRCACLPRPWPKNASSEAIRFASIRFVLRV